MFLITMYVNYRRLVKLISSISAAIYYLQRLLVIKNTIQLYLQNIVEECIYSKTRVWGTSERSPGKDFNNNKITKTAYKT